MDWYRKAIRMKELTLQKALEILGLQLGATKDEVTRARNLLAKKFHPDLGNDSHESMADVNSAFEFLSSHGFNTGTGSIPRDVDYYKKRQEEMERAKRAERERQQAEYLRKQKEKFDASGKKV